MDSISSIGLLLRRRPSPTYYSRFIKANKILFRDTSEKAWLPVVEATKSLFLTQGITPPKSHWERRRKLDELEQKDLKVRDLGLRDRFAARDYHLHQLGFCEGLIDENLMKIELEKVRKYIEDIEKLG